MLLVTMCACHFFLWCSTCCAPAIVSHKLRQCPCLSASHDADHFQHSFSQDASAMWCSGLCRSCFILHVVYTAVVCLRCAWRPVHSFRCTQLPRACGVWLLCSLLAIRLVVCWPAQLPGSIDAAGWWLFYGSLADLAARKLAIFCRLVFAGLFSRHEPRCVAVPWLHCTTRCC
jgi:hypothetical protein